MLFYLNSTDNLDKIRNLLRKTVSLIKSKEEDQEFFVNSLEEEFKEFQDFNIIGFPGNQNVIDDIKKGFK